MLTVTFLMPHWLNEKLSEPVAHRTGWHSSHLVRPIVTLFGGVLRCSHHVRHHSQTSKDMSAYECWSDDAAPSGERHLNNDIVQSDTINVEGHFVSNVFFRVRLVVLLRHLWPMGPYYSSSSEGSAERSSAMRCALRARSWRRRAAFLPGFSRRTAMFSLQCGQFIYGSLSRVSVLLVFTDISRIKVIFNGPDFPYHSAHLAFKPLYERSHFFVLVSADMPHAACRMVPCKTDFLHLWPMRPSFHQDCSLMNC